LLHGNLGESLTVGLSVNTVLRRALPPTLSLMIGGMVLWLVSGITVGAIGALWPGSWVDRIVTGPALSAMVIPTFLLTAVKQGDLMVVMGTVLVTVIVIALVNLIADICHALVDPQVHIT